MRQFSRLDQFVCGVDAALRAIFVPAHRSTLHENPANNLPDAPMNHSERKHTAGLMRVNHSGEVCAQALYQGQALTAKLSAVKQQMLNAAREEIDHLSWCEERLQELGSQPSVFNAFWYAGSLMLGAMAGLIGDGWSLGFVAETEQQVAQHLQKHLKQLVRNDEKTRAILEKMHQDETQHANMATNAGAHALPFMVKELMRMTSKLMTKTSYYM